MESIIKHYASARRREGARDWMWFGMYFDDEPESLPVYINGTDMKLTYDKPSCFVSRVQDTESFEQILLADGSVHTTRFDDTGQRLYLVSGLRGVLCMSRGGLKKAHGCRRLRVVEGPGLFQLRGLPEAARLSPLRRTHGCLVARGTKDYETGEWRTFPDEWCQDIVSSGDGSLHDHHGGWEVTGEQQDETFTHPGAWTAPALPRCSWCAGL